MRKALGLMVPASASVRKLCRYPLFLGICNRPFILRNQLAPNLGLLALEIYLGEAREMLALGAFRWYTGDLRGANSLWNIS